MTDTAVRPDVASRGHRRRRLWSIAAVIVVLVAGGAVTAVTVSFRYLHAPPLSAFNPNWTSPDAADVRATSNEGAFTLSVVARPGHRQTFEVDVENSSGVTQTVLGLTDGALLADPRSTGEPETLEVSTSALRRSAVRYTSKPVAIPPGGRYRLRYTRLTATGGLWSCGRRSTVTSLSLSVRVGAFTRTEHLGFGGTSMEIRSRTSVC